MFKTLMVLIVFLNLYDCFSQTSNDLLDDSLNKIILSTTQRTYYSYDNFFLLFEGKDSMMVSDLWELKGNYNSMPYFYLSLNISLGQYVKNVIKGEIELNCNQVTNCFLFDDIIRKEYENLGFELFKNKYTKSILSDTRLILSINGLESDDEFYTIVYYFYINGFFSLWADYEGFYLSIKILDEVEPELENYNIVLEEL